MSPRCSQTPTAVTFKLAAILNGATALQRELDQLVARMMTLGLIETEGDTSR